MVTLRASEQRRLPRACGVVRVGVRPAEPVVVEQAPHLVVSRDEPGVVADAGADLVDETACLQRAQEWRDLQRTGLREGKLDGHGAS
jgi:hypothetical protein